MDDLLALDGGRAARIWQEARSRRRDATAKLKQKRKAQDQREIRWDHEQRRKARVAKVEEDSRARKLRRAKLRAEIAKVERRAFLQARKAEGYKANLPYKDITGQRFGKLTVICPAGHNPSGSKRWWVQCTCGSPMKEVAGTNLKQGILRSCGCLCAEAGARRSQKVRAAKGRLFRRKLRSDLANWRNCFCGNRGDLRLLIRLRQTVKIIEQEAATMKGQKAPRNRQVH